MHPLVWKFKCYSQFFSVVVCKLLSLNQVDLVKGMTKDLFWADWVSRKDISLIVGPPMMAAIVQAKWTNFNRHLLPQLLQSIFIQLCTSLAE